MIKQSILVSSCLLGHRTRFDGNVIPIHPTFAHWQELGLVIFCCPEVLGGLPTPRPPSEIIKIHSVHHADGKDVSNSFDLGAKTALNVCQRHNIRIAILKDGSPSCGSETIYDGTFSGQKISGQGITTALLRENGILVFTENDLDQVATAMNLPV